MQILCVRWRFSTLNPYVVQGSAVLHSYIASGLNSPPTSPDVKRPHNFPVSLYVSTAEGHFLEFLVEPLPNWSFLAWLSQSGWHKPFTLLLCIHPDTVSPISKLTLPPSESTKWHKIENLNLSVLSLIRVSFYSWRKWWRKAVLYEGVIQFSLQSLL